MIFRRKPRLSFRILASTLLTSLLLVLTLAANPHWHELAHAHDCHERSGHEHGEHTCVVDQFASGAVHHTAPAPLFAIAPAALAVQRFVAATEHVASVFLSGSILEHAPPASP